HPLWQTEHQKYKIMTNQNPTPHDSVTPYLNHSTDPLPHHSITPFPLDPDPWPGPVDGKVLLDLLAQLLKRFVVLPKWAAETLALWILHTYAFLLRDVTTYI